MKTNLINAAIQSLDFIKESETLVLEGNGDAETIAFIVLDPDRTPALINENTVDLSRNKVWQMLFESTYRKSQPTDEVFDTTTWVSTYDHEVMPAAEIAIWQQETVKRIATLNPQSIWEIGCGSGLLMWQLLDRVDYFYGTDLSQDIISRVSKSLADKNISKVKLEYRAPEDIPSFDEPTFDLAVINSVAQYFSGMHYLNRVIQSALKATKKGIFIGDVRSLAHHEVFLTSVELFQAQDSDLPSDIYNKVQSKLKSERELLIHESYFLRLAESPLYPLAVEAKIKRGTFTNEMSRWRYDVSLTKVNALDLVKPTISSAWEDIKILRNLLMNSPNQSVEILDIPNIRVAADVWATTHLQESPGNVAQLKAQAKIETAGAVDPDLLFILADELNLKVRVIWSQQNLAHLHALFESKEAPMQTWAPDQKKAPHQLTSDPAGKSLEKKILELVNATLGAELNEDDLPNKVIKLDCMPLTTDGKLDLAVLKKLSLKT